MNLPAASYGVSEEWRPIDLNKYRSCDGLLGLLSRFVGMLTNSRSFMSYTRHEYFRRILCNLIGEWVENGEAPNDVKLLGGMVKDISYNNAVKYFQFG